MIIELWSENSDPKRIKNILEKIEILWISRFYRSYIYNYFLEDIFCEN